MDRACSIASVTYLVGTLSIVCECKIPSCAMLFVGPQNFLRICVQGTRMRSASAIINNPNVVSETALTGNLDTKMAVQRQDRADCAAPFWEIL
jgi:hypothetical protein